MAGMHGWYAWPVCVAGMHGWYAWLVHTAGPPGRGVRQYGTSVLYTDVAGCVLVLATLPRSTAYV